MWFKKLNNFWRFIKNFPYKIKRSVEISIFYWNKPDYDYSTILQLMKFQIQKTRLHLDEHNIVPKHKLKQMLIAEHLLERMLNDSQYFSNADLRYPYPNDIKRRYAFVVYLQEQDKELLYKILRKHLNSWWD